MLYYYDITNYDSNSPTEELKLAVCEKDAERIASQIEKHLSCTIGQKWTRRDQFGWVFTDSSVKEEDSRKLIGSGQKYLFEEIQNEYYCILLSEVLKQNFEEFTIDGKKCIHLNVKHFKEFHKHITDKKKTAKLFLYKFKNEAYSEFIRTWIKGSGEVKEIEVPYPVIDIEKIEEVLQKNKIESPDDLQKIIDVSKIFTKVIESKPEYFETILKEFYDKKENEKIKENDIRDFILKHIWLLDFKYLEYPIKKREYRTKVGRIDLYLYKKQFSIHNVAVIEFKKPTAPIVGIDPSRPNKPMILRDVSTALSQVINYIENLPKENYTNIEGMVVIGRKIEEMDEFITIFNKYSQIKIVTFDDLYHKALTIVEAFKNPNELQPINESENE